MISNEFIRQQARRKSNSMTYYHMLRCKIIVGNTFRICSKQCKTHWTKINDKTLNLSLRLSERFLYNGSIFHRCMIKSHEIWEEAYPFSHNHGSVENYPNFKESNLGDIPCSTEPWFWEETLNTISSCQPSWQRPSEARFLQFRHRGVAEFHQNARRTLHFPQGTSARMQWQNYKV